MNFKKFYILFSEARFNDKEYNHPNAAWRLTYDEYLEETNKSGKFHSFSSYQPREIVILDYDPNPPIEVNVKPNHNNNWVDVYWTLKDGTHGGKARVSPLEVSTEKDKFKFAQSWSNSDKKYKKIYDKYWYSMSENYTKKQFPYKLQTIDGIEYRIRKEKVKRAKSVPDDEYSYLRDEKGNLVYYSDQETKEKGWNLYDIAVGAFDGEEMIGMAVDEWGALLVTVQPEHRGRGIGSTLSHLYRTIYPRKDSGGYTSQGKQMAKKVHEKAVRDAKKLGWYEKAIKDGSISREKTKTILQEYNL